MKPVGKVGGALAITIQIILLMSEVIQGIEELTNIKLMALKGPGNHQIVGREITQ